METQQLRNMEWESFIGKNGRRYIKSTDPSQGGMICEMLRTDATAVSNESSYATLIAAAPRLFRTLQNMIQEWCEIVGDEETNTTPADTLEQARAAVALALHE